MIPGKLKATRTCIAFSGSDIINPTLSGKDMSDLLNINHLEILCLATGVTEPIH